MTLEQIRKKISDANGELASKKREVEELILTKENLEKKIEYGEEGLIILQEVALATQKNMEDYFSNLVTLALKSVDSSWAEFKIEMVIRRGQTECDLYAVENGHESDPMFSTGGGWKDVASFTLLLIDAKLNKGRPTLVLDEPFRNVSPDLQHNTSEMLDLISKELSYQILMISHAEDINDCAAKTFQCTKVGKVSKVKEV